MNIVVDNAKGWIGEFDLLRGFAIMAIVFIHIGAFSLTIDHTSVITPVAIYLTHLADFGVPLFFFISGFVLTLRYFRPVVLRTFYRKRLMMVIPPYLAFSAVYALYNYVSLDQTSMYRAAWSFVLFDSAGVFWFLAIIVQFYLLFPFLVRWLTRLEAQGQSWKFLAYTGGLYVAWWAALYQLTALGINAVWQPVPGLGYIVADRLFPGFLLFFALGIYASRSPRLTSETATTLGKTYMVIPALALAAALALLNTGFVWYMVVVPFSLIMFALLARLSRWITTAGGAAFRSLRTVGEYSFGLYLIHVLVIAVVVNRLWAWGLQADDAFFYLILFPATVLIGILALYVLNWIPLGHYISGVRVKRSRRRKSERAESPAQD